MDAPVDGGTPPLARLRSAQELGVAVFCRCLPTRDPSYTEARCLALAGPNADVSACEDEATAAVGAGFDGYYRCVTAATEAQTACMAAPGACNDATVVSCNGVFATALSTCQSMISATAGMTYVDTYRRCITERVTGTAMGCPDAPTEVSSALGTAVFSGSTTLAGDDTAPATACFADPMDEMNARGAPDRAFRWAAPSAGRFRFDTVGSSYDTLLYLRDTCDASMDLACADDIELGLDQDSCVIVDLAAAQEVVLVVDGFGELAHGAFVVNVLTAGATETCPTTAVTPPG